MTSSQQHGEPPGAATPVSSRRCARAIKAVSTAGYELFAVMLTAWRSGPGICAGMAGLAVVGGLLPASTAWSMKIVVDAVVAGNAASTLLWAAGVLAGIGLLMAIEPHVTQYLGAELGRRVDRRVQEQLYTAVSAFTGISRFEQPRFLDRLMMASQANGPALMPAVTGSFEIARSAISLAGLLTALALLSPPMALLLAATAVPALAAQISLSRRQQGLLLQLTPDNRRQMLYLTLLTDVQAAKETRLLGLGRFFRGRLLTALDRVHHGERRMDQQVTRVQALLALLGAAVAGLGLVWVTLSAGTGGLGAGDLTAFIAAVAGAQAAVAALVGGVAGAHHALLIFRHHVGVTALPDDLPVRPDPVALRPLRTGIELRDVWFRYSADGPWVLQGVDLTIPAGRSLGVVGVNGAGKSTLVKLLCRFYDPVRGAIYWDGIDIRHVDPAQLRSRMGVLFQDFVRYDLTAQENVGLGDLDRFEDREPVAEAARRAGIDEHLRSLPHGYDTLLSRTFLVDAGDGDPEAGADLSGGQWQRLALARALMRRDRDLLVLDEPNAGMDAEAEHHVHRRLTELRAGRTSVLVSHRLGTLRTADRIAVLSAGRVVELGTHAELLDVRGLYARLFALQASGYRDPATPGPHTEPTSAPIGSGR